MATQHSSDYDIIYFRLIILIKLGTEGAYASVECYAYMPV